MSSLQIQARALGDPTRHRIFRFVADADHPVTVADLTDHLGFNHNAVRQHLAKLVDAKLVLESQAAPNGRGRPKLLYSLDPTSESRWDVVGPYERLAVLLAEVVQSGESPEVVGRRAGRALFANNGGTAADPVAEFNLQMARQGFEPDIERSDGDFRIRLDNCPFMSAAATDPTVVCQLHLGLARGVADAIGGLEIHDLEVREPTQAGCVLNGTSEV